MVEGRWVVRGAPRVIVRARRSGVAANVYSNAVIRRLLVLVV